MSCIKCLMSTIVKFKAKKLKVVEQTGAERERQNQRKENKIRERKLSRFSPYECASVIISDRFFPLCFSQCFSVSIRHPISLMFGWIECVRFGCDNRQNRLKLCLANTQSLLAHSISNARPWMQFWTGAYKRPKTQTEWSPKAIEDSYNVKPSFM